LLVTVIREYDFLFQNNHYFYLFYYQYFRCFIASYFKFGTAIVYYFCNQIGIIITDYYISEEIFISLASQFYKDPRGFLYFKIENEKNCNSFNAKQLNRYIYVAATIIKGTPVPLLIDLSNITGVPSSSTFRLLANNDTLNTNFTKISFIVNSLSLKLLIHNYIRIYQPCIPSRVFNTIEKSIDYLEYNPQTLTWK
jgi:hypothetical protein